jgi:hypothetical protein
MDHRLYPRLPRAAATLRFETLTTRTPEEARRLAVEVMPSDIAWTATGPPRVTKNELESLRKDVIAAVAHLPFDEPLSRLQRDDFDRTLIRTITEATGLFPAEASQLEVWSYFALALLPDLALWRWSFQEKLNVERFVGIDLTRHTFGRLWWRAYTFTAGDAKDVEGWDLLSRLNEADIDQLQSRRAAYGVDPAISKALAAVYLEARAQAEARGLSGRAVWRDLLKRILRRGAFVNFGALPAEVLQEGARSMLNDSLVELVDGKGSDEHAERWQAFDDVPLGYLSVAVTEAVEEAGLLADAAVPDAVADALGIEVPGRFRSYLSGFAWLASTSGYVKRDEESGGWKLGDTAPAPDPRWGDWTVRRIRHAANGGGVDDDLIGRVFAGRPGRTVKRVVKAAAKSSP